MIFSTLFISALAGAAASRVSYSGSSVLRCRAESREKLDFLHDLELKNDLGLDFWQEAKNLNSPVDMLVSGAHRAVGRVPSRGPPRPLPRRKGLGRREHAVAGRGYPR